MPSFPYFGLGFTLTAALSVVAVITVAMAINEALNQEQGFSSNQKECLLRRREREEQEELEKIKNETRKKRQEVEQELHQLKLMELELERQKQVASASHAEQEDTQSVASTVIDDDEECCLSEGWTEVSEQQQ